MKIQLWTINKILRKIGFILVVTVGDSTHFQLMTYKSYRKKWPLCPWWALSTVSGTTYIKCNLLKNHEGECRE